MTVKLFLIDEDAMYRMGVRAAAEQAENVVVVGEGPAFGDDVLECVRNSGGIDVVLVGVPHSGACIDLVRTITGNAAPGGRAPRVLMVSSSGAEEAAVVAAVRAGAQGYISRGISGEELFRAVQVVADGGAVFGPSVAARLGTYFSPPDGMPGRAAFPSLTDRELQILEYIARGWDNRRIARSLVLSEKTIKNHVTRLFRKLEVKDRMSAAMRARDAEAGLLSGCPAE
ncbi:response regulator transcription factor [Streptomyces sp. NPDC046261]|uniref:response regulator transcription factor n=1 Tax=Streptomyces sp. NPDC046261 TaxID=3157200 RepID=UPI0033E3A3DE